MSTWATQALAKSSEDTCQALALVPPVAETPKMNYVPMLCIAVAMAGYFVLLATLVMCMMEVSVEEASSYSAAC